MKKVVAAALAILMAFAVLTACSGKKDDATGGNTGNSTDPNTSVNDPGTAPSDPGTTPDESAAADLPAATITVLFEGSSVTDDTAVVAAVNDRLKALGTNITFRPIWGTWGDFDPTASNALDTSSTDIDIYFTCSWTADTYVPYAKNGSFARLDDPEDNLLAKYGKDMRAAVPAVLWNGFTLEGADGMGIYGVPGYKDYAQLYTWDVNNTLLSELGIDINSMKWDSSEFFSDAFAAALKAAKEAKGDNFYPLYIEGELFARAVCNSDTDPTNMGILFLGFDPQDPSKPEKPVVTSRYDEDIYIQYLDKIREFYLAGYIDPRMSILLQANDAMTAQKNAGAYLIGVQAYAYGYDVQASAERNIDAKFMPMSKAIVSTGSVQGAGYAVSVYSKNKAQAVQFLNAWYTDPELATLLAYGLEGTHYTKNSDGTVTFNTEARASYTPWRNGMGNIFILPPEDSTGPNYWNEFKAYNNAGVGTGLIGFSFDPAPVQNEIGALINTNAEYMLPLLTGSVDPAEKLPEFREKMKANGLQTVIDEYNRQIDAFFAAK